MPTKTDQTQAQPLSDREHRMFVFLAEDDSPYVRSKAFSNPACPEPILYAAARTETHPHALKALATNPASSGRVLHRLMGVPNFSVRNGIAAHLNTNAADLIVLAADKNVYVLGWVALNPNAPKKALSVALETALRLDPMSDFVPFHVARHPRVPQRVLRVLAEYQSDRVRAEVVKNPACPMGVVLTLMGDASDRVRGALAARLGVEVRVAD